MLNGLAGHLRRRDLRGRVVIVTGASSGVGRRTTVRLARAGAVVFAVARHQDALDEVASEAVGVVPEAADLQDAAARGALVERVLERHGRVDVLVNNLGIGWAGPVEDMDLQQVRSLTEANLVAPVHLTLGVLPGMLERRDGDILFVASTASWFATPPLAYYCATKYGVEGFAEGLRREVMARGVRVHTIHPGPVSTQFAVRSAGDQPGEVRGTPRPGPGIDPERVAVAVQRSLTRPGWHVTSVPRVLGLTRVTKLPPLQQLTDVAVGLVGPRLARRGRDVAEDAAGRAIR